MRPQEEAKELSPWQGLASQGREDWYLGKQFSPKGSGMGGGLCPQHAEPHQRRDVQRPDAPPVRSTPPPTGPPRGWVAGPGSPRDSHAPRGPEPS